MENSLPWSIRINFFSAFSSAKYAKTVASLRAKRSNPTVIYLLKKSKEKVNKRIASFIMTCILINCFTRLFKNGDRNLNEIPPSSGL